MRIAALYHTLHEAENADEARELLVTFASEAEANHILALATVICDADPKYLADLAKQHKTR